MVRRKRTVVKTIYKVMAIQFGLALLALLVIEVAVFAVLKYRNRIRPDSVLVLNVRGEVSEDAPRGLWGGAAGRVSILSDLLEAIDRARNDDRINGLVLRMGGFSMNMAKLQELREKIKQFNQAGKFSVTFLESADNRSYYLATACQSITLVPHSVLFIRGLMAETDFLRGTLDKLGIEPNFIHTGRYKTAANALTEKGYTPAHRESVEALLRDWYDDFLTGIAGGRGLEPVQVGELVEQGPFTAQEALAAGLVDRVAYRDEFDSNVEERNAKSENQVGVARYLGQTEPEGEAKVAVVFASGTIVTGKSHEDMMLGRMLGSDTVSQHLRQVREDDSFKAVILRVDSPGGSVVASEVIRREVSLTRQKKPVVVSMSDLAASGGYWISMGVDRIVAQQGTLTGSIGVIIGKLNVRGLYEKLGMSKDYVALTENATIVWPFMNFSRAQRKKIGTLIQETYQTFKEGVSEGRGMKLEEVEKIAQGRVWTGKRAVQLGLVDELGGVDKAAQLAKQLAQIAPEEKVRLVYILPRETLFDRIEDLLERFGVLSHANYREAVRVKIPRLIEDPVWALLPFVPQVR